MWGRAAVTDLVALAAPDEEIAPMAQAQAMPATISASLIGPRLISMTSRYLLWRGPWAPASGYDRTAVLLGFGGHFVFQQLLRGGWVAVLAGAAMVVLVLNWPRITAWVERRWPAR
jgi:hypothetical protein